MNQVFRFTGYSKQAFHQKLNRQLRQREQHLLLLPIVAQLRKEHPGMAVRQLYSLLRPVGIGRDKFERLCFQQGYKLSTKRSLIKTTDSNGVIRFPNLVAGREFTEVNRAWASDITYYQIDDNVYYLTFIIDVFTRMIVGYSVSKRLLTNMTTIPALQMAITNRKPSPATIIHSDGGGQYYCKDFLKITNKYGLKNSMCDMAYENPYAERINGTIKNQYLKGYAPKDYTSLVMATKRAVNNYNNWRPHRSLNNLSPIQFEKLLPAGGASLDNDNFCSDRIPDLRNQKNHHHPMKLSLSLTSQKRVEKMVNVF